MNNTQLPTEQELFDILALESPRQAVKFDFLDQYIGEFDAYLEVADDASWVTRYREVPLDQLLQRRDATTEALVHKILAGGLSRSQCDRLYRNLCAGCITSGIDGAPRADAAFVFGSPNDSRVKLAIECYFRNATPKIILSGQGPHYQDFDETEADRMKQVALTAGVPVQAIIVENQSVTLPDNVKRTLDLFQAINWRPRDLVIISTTVIMLRSLMEWYKFTPWDLELHALSPRPSDPDMEEDSWFRTERGVRIVLNEYAKMVVEHKMDLIRKDNN